jgi:hypothetical protein
MSGFAASSTDEPPVPVLAASAGRPGDSKIDSNDSNGFAATQLAFFGRSRLPLNLRK